MSGTDNNNEETKARSNTVVQPNLHSLWGPHTVPIDWEPEIRKQTTKILKLRLEGTSSRATGSICSGVSCPVQQACQSDMTSRNTFAISAQHGLHRPDVETMTSERRVSRGFLMHMHIHCHSLRRHFFPSRQNATPQSAPLSPRSRIHKHYGLY